MFGNNGSDENTRMRVNPIFEEPNHPVKNNNQCDSDTSGVSPQWFVCEPGWRALWWCSSAEQVSPQSNAGFSIAVWCWVCCIGTMQNPYFYHHLNIRIKLYANPCSTNRRRQFFTVIAGCPERWYASLSPCEHDTTRGRPSFSPVTAQEGVLWDLLCIACVLLKG